ncbi:cbb3-type cytochrome c oxidase subunit I [Dyadobacter chenhuakuii]|uniref:Cbb3-type cytochrome c oxidase subunit I n=1 Tax=Dyadobacter chenhuakuii TaxID=2909339 RepID=A0A9X1QHU1_9BACT|nr:cbb3-type cytochrome c oxidase subunit I [Dyadobacter chenhuakuii]MCF2501321.1 cbb3-type cytochrome c oxidase subunit I [Dyadobacter chenhuakuii]
MMTVSKCKIASGLCLCIYLVAIPAHAETQFGEAVALSLGIVTLVMALGLLSILILVKDVVQNYFLSKINPGRKDYSKYLHNLSSRQVSLLLDRIVKKQHLGFILLTILSLVSLPSFAQSSQPTADSLMSQGGILITIVLIAIPVLAGAIFLFFKITNTLNRYRNQQRVEEAGRVAAYLDGIEVEVLAATLQQRKDALDFALSHNELSGGLAANDHKGLINNVEHEASLPFVARKRKAHVRPKVDPQLSRLIAWFVITATFWLVFGTTVGEYIGIKFVSPDADQVSWLSFGRLRPVHTNAVFWGWASLAMLGLGNYVVPRVSNAKLFSIKLGWYSLILINTAVLLGTLCLMAGINNGGGEYREYIWPVMLLFGIGLLLTLINYFKTVASRTTKEIYISNWYIVSSVIFGIVIVVVAYVPLWQNGLGETIIQGYYMHQGVGMWFMLFTLGIVYYFLPQQLNKPIYSYSLGILAFWTQILFYTLIGTHHFVFSAIPWWLQTVAIVGSVGMIIPVVAGTTNFLLTFKGAWYKITDSYTLPFFLTGILFYFTGSMQGTAEAFRSTNLIWHFTDFTVAHSHLTMYGIICFLLWAGIYALMPRITGHEPPQVTVGAHFWLALIGLLFYTIPLMYGSTMRGLMWMEAKPFIDSVSFMAPFWLWRAIGGSLMWLSHLFFAYNLYRMVVVPGTVDIKETAFEKLRSMDRVS